MVKRILKIICTALIVVIFLAAYIIYNSFSQFKKLNRAEITNEIVSDTIPFTYSSSGHIIIQAKIEENEKSHSFIFDSGASNFIFSNHIDELKLEKTGWGVGIGSSENFFITSLRKIETLHIGSLEFKNLSAKEIDFNFSCTDNIYGIIGIGVMRQLVWQVDFNNKIILVSKTIDGLTFSNSKIEIPLSENKYGHQLRANFLLGKQKKNIPVLVDLGSSGALSLKEAYITKDSTNFKYKTVIGRASKGLGEEETKISQEKIYLADSAYLGSSIYKIYNLPISTSPKGLNMLGLSFLKKFKITISWQDRLLILEPYKPTQNFIWNTAGFFTKYDTKLKKVIVSNIIEESPASRAGIPLYSEVISINDHSFYDEASYCKYRNSEIKKDTVKVELNISGIRKKYSLANEPIFTIL